MLASTFSRGRKGRDESIGAWDHRALLIGARTSARPSTSKGLTVGNGVVVALPESVSPVTYMFLDESSAIDPVN